MTFAVMNPEFSGCYLAVCDGNITTAKFFDTKNEMYGWIRDMLENKGYEQVQTTIIDGNGEVSKKLTCKSATYLRDDDCYKGGKYEPEIGTDIRVVYTYEGWKTLLLLLVTSKVHL